MSLDAELAPVIKAPIKQHVFVCTGKSCSANNSEATLDAIKAALRLHGLLYNKKDNPEGAVMVTACGSVGLCKIGPAVLIYPEGIWYHSVTLGDVEELVKSHFIKNETVKRLIAKNL